ncbi:MAG: hypothetical protein R2711_08240 [Acidimicrobiales bacterium]
MVAGLLPGGSPPPAGFEPWCLTLRGEQAWRHEVGGGAAALELWRQLRDRHPRTGLWPILLGDDPQVVDQLTWRLGMLARSTPGIPELEDAPDVADLFDGWMAKVAQDGYLDDVPRHLAKLEADAAAIRERMAARPDEAAVRAVAAPAVTIALVPAAPAGRCPPCSPGPVPSARRSTDPSTSRCCTSGPSSTAPSWWPWASSASSCSSSARRRTRAAPSSSLSSTTPTAPS